MKWLIKVQQQIEKLIEVEKPVLSEGANDTIKKAESLLPDSSIKNENHIK